MEPARNTEIVLDAVRAAVGTPGEHRLFRAGKLPGLFPSRAGASAEAALQALKDGLLETVRTETRGKVVTEWVTATPRAVAFVHDHDSPKAVLRELREVLRATRAGVPVWLDESRQELATLTARFEGRAAAMLDRLDRLADRVEAALRRAEVSAPAVGPGTAGVVPWAIAALEYLDRRRGDCPLPELFAAVRDRFPDLTLPAFHDGLRRLHDARAVRLLPAEEMPEPEYAVVVDGELAYRVSR
ncbi:MAG: hypothetical protein K2X87_33745 [Gemmataceae bacterium]|nr:hypothetical protein [Gemmataceae bacterium]